MTWCWHHWITGRLQMQLLLSLSGLAVIYKTSVVIWQLAGNKWYHWTVWVVCRVYLDNIYFKTLLHLLYQFSLFTLIILDEWTSWLSRYIFFLNKFVLSRIEAESLFWFFLCQRELEIRDLTSLTAVFLSHHCVSALSGREAHQKRC